MAVVKPTTRSTMMLFKTISWAKGNFGAMQKLGCTLLSTRFSTSEGGPSFEDLMKNSPLMKIDRFQGQTVIGKITHVCGDDLYVDYGGKFEAVVKRPKDTNPKSNYFQEGKLVEIILQKPELTGHFLGQNKRISLLEADATLIGYFVKK